MYFAVTKGRNRVLPKAEILGRLVSCGFEIIEHLEVENKFHFIVRKVRTPAYDLRPSYGPIFKMKRVGQGGRPIGVYKFRTMHAYAEYLQSHVHENNKLAKNGKLNDDFRVTTWGRVMRRLWIDELPMLINWFKGEVKLVGVRPLSEHYLSLYPQRVAEHRLRHKPGLVPPYYADLPQSFDEIVESEEKYLQAYEQHPRTADIRYFFKACYNILINRTRSQ
jgi:lipopolysaccharide/colanic/teichoic acid biosynthesis glycosyltransferase